MQRRLWSTSPRLASLTHTIPQQEFTLRPVSKEMSFHYCVVNRLSSHIQNDGRESNLCRVQLLLELDAQFFTNRLEGLDVLLVLTLVLDLLLDTFKDANGGRVVVDTRLARRGGDSITSGDGTKS